MMMMLIRSSAIFVLMLSLSLTVINFDDQCCHQIMIGLPSSTFGIVAVQAYSTNTGSVVTTSPHHQRQQRLADNGEDNNSNDEITVKRIPWLIIGGGIHGVHIATRILGSTTTDSRTTSKPNPLCVIVDPNPKLLHQWKSRTSATGMKYLRSSVGYHLDLNENSLRQHKFEDMNIIKQIKSHTAKRKQRKKRKKIRGAQSSPKDSTDSLLFTKDYERPRLDVFNDHCDTIIDKYSLQKLHQQGYVTSIEPPEDKNCVKVLVSSISSSDDESSNKNIVYWADKIVLAIGNDEPAYPTDWVDDDDIQTGLVQHLLDDTAVCTEHCDGESIHGNVAIVGGGISAAHKASELVEKQKQKHAGTVHTKIHLISRHHFREQQFDTHQDWMMDRAAVIRSKQNGGYGVPKRQRLFAKKSLDERRKTILKERIPGTVTPAVYRGNHGLKYAIEKGHLDFHHDEVISKSVTADTTNGASTIQLTLDSGKVIENVDKVLLATGFGKRLPGGKMIQKLIEDANLPTSCHCGYPVVNDQLQWGSSRIYVSGGLAELELGPSARNIAGARLAAERIIPATNNLKF